MSFSVGLGYHTRIAHKAISRQLAEAMHAQGVPFKHYYYLRALYEEDGITQGELAERTGMERATVTRVLDTMEAGDFIVRIRDTNDRRKVNVYLTPYAKSLRSRVRRTIDRLNREILGGISDAELRVYYAVLRRVVTNAGGSLADLPDIVEISAA